MSIKNNKVEATSANNTINNTKNNKKENKTMVNTTKLTSKQSRRLNVKNPQRRCMTPVSKKRN